MSTEQEQQIELSKAIECIEWSRNTDKQQWWLDQANGYLSKTEKNYPLITEILMNYIENRTI